MGNEDSVTKAVAAAVPKLTAILTSLTAEGRQRAIRSAMAIFGDESAESTESKKDPAEKAEKLEDISKQALAWIKNNQLNREQLDHVFAIDKDSVEVIASAMPETGKVKQTRQAYILCGAAAFLKTGEIGFADAQARKVCEKVGAYDSANHAIITKKFGNLITGSKNSGWKLTNPGLKEAANIIKILMPKESS